jgi:hypothetical protein
MSNSIKKRLMWTAQLIGLGGFVLCAGGFVFNHELPETVEGALVFFAIYIWGRRPWND